MSSSASAVIGAIFSLFLKQSKKIKITGINYG